MACSSMAIARPTTKAVVPMTKAAVPVSALIATRPRLPTG
jgi:hypothetical protein